MGLLFVLVAEAAAVPVGDGGLRCRVVGDREEQQFLCASLCDAPTSARTVIMEQMAVVLDFDCIELLPSLVVSIHERKTE